MLRNKVHQQRVLHELVGVFLDNLLLVLVKAHRLLQLPLKSVYSFLLSKASFDYSSALYLLLLVVWFWLVERLIVAIAHKLR